MIILFVGIGFVAGWQANMAYLRFLHKRIAVLKRRTRGKR